ncbi:MAG: choice-of-anchor D domain-containing protein [Thermodesulfovibrionales bacterium]
MIKQLSMENALYRFNTIRNVVFDFFLPKSTGKLTFVKTLKILVFMCIFSLIGLERVSAQNLVLENEYLYIELQQTLPAVEKYVLKSNGQIIYGDIARDQYYSEIFYQDVLHYSYPFVDSVTQESDRVCYHMRGELDSKLAVTFDLCYILSGFSVKVVFSNIQEISGYKLIHVRSPELLTVRATQQGAKLVFPFGEGHIIDIASSTTGFDIVNYGRWDRPLLAGMAYYQGMVSVCSYDNLDMMMYERISDHPNEGRLGSIGMYFNYRYAPTNFDLASFVEVFDEKTTAFTVTLTFVADYDRDGDIDWMDGAKIFRDSVNAAPEPRYLKSFIAKIGRNGIEHISEHLETIRRLYNLTDHNKIDGYLLDCRKGTQILQFFGVADDLDPNWGSLSDLTELFQSAEKKYNTFLSFHDNYTDYYPGTSGFDKTLVGIQADGTPYHGWAYIDYPNAYHTDPYDYALQSGLNRIRNTLARYPIKESYHLDVFNVSIDQDYSLESPSNRERNRRGLGFIINEFNKFDINITSEVLTGPFVGSGIGWFLHIPRVFEIALPFSVTESIPLIEFIYHGKTLYGYALYDFPPGYPPQAAFLEPLLLGANSGAHITWSEPGDLELDKFYLIDLPWMALNQRFMGQYETKGNYRKITYDENTFVEIDYGTNRYTVQVDGRVIGKDYTTYFPKDDSTFLIFSRDAKTVSLTIPQDWIEKPNYTIKLFKLTEEGTSDGPAFQVNKTMIVFSANANTPYKLVLVPCSCLISPDQQSFTASGGTGSVNVIAESNCSWESTSNASWITITSGSSGNGSGSVSYTVAANSNQSNRTGNMTIAGQTFTTNQDSVNSYALTANKSGTGSGTVTSNPVGISCGNLCSASFTSDVQVILTANPDSGSTFSSWSGCNSTDDNQCTVTMNTVRSVTAIFTLKPTQQYTLTVTKSRTVGIITSSPKGIDCGSDCSETYQKSSRSKQVTLKAKPNAHSTFLGWGGDCQSSGTKISCKLTMDSSKNVSASFGLPDIEVSPSSYDFGNIKVKQTSSPATFTIKNIGTGNLKITKIKVTSTNKTDKNMFKIKSGAKKPIPSGGSFQFTIKFKPATAGQQYVTLRITSNDPYAPSMPVPLSGAGM